MTPPRTLVVVALAACHAPHADPVGARAPTTPGISIAAYDDLALVEDRRTIEVTRDGRATLQGIDDTADIGSLSVDADGLAFAACSRASILETEKPAADAAFAKEARIAEDAVTGKPRIITEAGESAVPRTFARIIPTITCDVRGPAGRHFARLSYVSHAYAYTARTELAIATDAHGDGKAHLEGVVAIPTPLLHARGTITVFGGHPGDVRPVVELAQAPIVLDGSTAIVPLPARDVPAHLRRVYRAASEDAGDPENDPLYRPSVAKVTVDTILELDGDLPRTGAITARVTEPDTEERQAAATPLDEGRRHQLFLWVDPELHASHRRTSRVRGDRVVDRVTLSFGNNGARPREIWVEEPIRPTKTPTVTQTWPATLAPKLGPRFARMKVVVPPAQVARLGFVVEYR